MTDTYKRKHACALAPTSLHILTRYYRPCLSSTRPPPLGLFTRPDAPPIKQGSVLLMYGGDVIFKKELIEDRTCFLRDSKDRSKVRLGAGRAPLAV